MDPKDIRTKAIFDLTRQIYYCATCGKFVVGDYVVVDSNSYHKACFKCQQCTTANLLKGYHNFQGKLLCTSCYLRKLPECIGCKKPIESSSCVKINDGCWHFDCFVCVQCKKKFDEGRYYVYDKYYLCMDHYWEKKEKELESARCG